MKRFFCILFTFSICFFFPSNADAQCKFGVKAGATLTKSSIDSKLFSSESRMGFVFSPMLDVKIPLIGLGFDLAAQYTCKHSTLTAVEETELESGSPVIHTIDIPFNIKWTIGDDDYISAYGATGPQISWNIGDKTLKELLNPLQYEIKSTRFSWNIGAGLNITRGFRIGYNYNIAIGQTADVTFKTIKEEVIHSKLRNHNHQVFIVHFF